MSNLRYIARSLAFLPPILLLAGAIGVVSCGKSIYSTSSSSTASPTSTPTPTGGYAFVTNRDSGYISEFKRNITSGFLTYNARIAAGATGGNGGPLGIAITGNNQFLYACNSQDGNIYQYTVSASGVLTPMTPPSVANGTKTSPIQVLTLSVSGTPTWLFVTNSGNGSVAVYSISSAGPLGTTPTTTLTGFRSPFGMAINSTGTILYVSDNAAGLIYSLGFNSSTGALSNLALSPTNSLPSNPGNPGFLALSPVISGSGAYLLAGDTNPSNTLISLFFISSTGTGVLTTPTQGTPGSQAAIGTAWIGTTTGLSANNGTGSSGTGSITSYTVSGSSLITGITVNPVNGPISIVVDPQVHFAYSTNSEDGTISQYPIGANCTNGAICPATRSVASDKASNPAPYGIVLSN
jgi:DNA-binding beta-propeller fold protein YncE